MSFYIVIQVSCNVRAYINQKSKASTHLTFSLLDFLTTVCVVVRPAISAALSVSKATVSSPSNNLHNDLRKGRLISSSKFVI